MHTSILVQPIPLFSTLKPNSKPKPETISKSKPVSSIYPLFLLPPNSHFLPTKISAMNAGNSAEMLTRNEPENDELIVETCFSRTLPPALTLHHGLQALKDAVLEFKLNPPSCSSGFVRFQVAVPPTASALNWFCCQPESSGVFPQFYLSKQSETLKNEPALSSKSRGVFGIGAAVCFRHSTSSADNWNSFRRYLLVESLNVKAYGFIGINYDIKSSIMKHETASFYFVIPQIELNEYESCCMLTGTLVWGGSTGQNLNQALLSCGRSLFQAVDYIPPMREAFNRNIIGSAIRCFNIVKDEDLEMVYIDAPALGACDDAAALEEMVSLSS